MSLCGYIKELEEEVKQLREDMEELKVQHTELLDIFKDDLCGVDQALC